MAPQIIFDIARFSEILMLRRKIFEFLLLVKRKVSNFIGKPLSLAPLFYTVVSYDFKELEMKDLTQLKYFYCIFC